MKDMGFKVRFISRFWGDRAFTIWFPFVKRPIIFIPRERRHNPDWVSLTRAHEGVHARQQRDMGRFRFWASRMTRSGRLRIEAEAYAASVRWYMGRGLGYPLGDKAYSLADNYGLRITVAQAKRAIREWL